MGHFMTTGKKGLVADVSPSKTVAIVIPMHNRKELTSDEQISFKHLSHYLNAYDKYLVVPEMLDLSLPGCMVMRFDNQYFGSVEAYTRLMLTEHFYRAFDDYKYMLIYHLDALVFSDQLLEWCETDLDYVGPPWFPCDDSPWVKTPRVGNGGLSLRKISTFLRVFHSEKYWVHPNEYWHALYADKPAHVRMFNWPRKFAKRLLPFNNARHEMAQWHLRPDGTKNEDHFWSDRAIHYYPELKVASFDVGLRFAFEVAPRLCYELNQRKLPFGCHAWPRYDRRFWEQFLLA
jgi:Protein of unknown function (DUF5672)